MSTIGYTTWAVDLADVGAVYPLQGWEIPMTILGVAFWLTFHRIQFVNESRHLEKAEQLEDSEKIDKILENY